MTEAAQLSGKAGEGNAPAPSSGGAVARGLLEDLAAASRILVDQGVFDAAGHFSMRHPAHPDRRKGHAILARPVR